MTRMNIIKITIWAAKLYINKKEKIDPYIPIDLKCPQHPRVSNNLFCIDEKGKKFYKIFQTYTRAIFNLIVKQNIKLILNLA